MFCHVSFDRSSYPYLWPTWSCWSPVSIFRTTKEDPRGKTIRKGEVSNFRQFFSDPLNPVVCSSCSCLVTMISPELLSSTVGGGVWQ